MHLVHKVVHFLSKPAYAIAVALALVWTVVCLFKFRRADTWILGITALMIGLYTVETSTLVELTAKQIDINIRPVMIITRPAPNLVLKNVGRSTALNIEIASIERKGYRLVFPERLVCVPEDDFPLVPQVLDINGTPVRGGGDEIARIWEQCLSCDGEDRYEITVSYRDIENTARMSIFLITGTSVNLTALR